MQFQCLRLQPQTPPEIFKLFWSSSNPSPGAAQSLPLPLQGSASCLCQVTLHFRIVAQTLSQSRSSLHHCQRASTSLREAGEESGPLVPSVAAPLCRATVKVGIGMRRKRPCSNRRGCFFERWKEQPSACFGEDFPLSSSVTWRMTEVVTRQDALQQLEHLFRIGKGKLLSGN